MFAVHPLNHIDGCLMSGPHTGRNISSTIKVVSKKFAQDNNWASITTDGASNMLNAAHACCVNGVLNESVRCVAHALHLVTKPICSCPLVAKVRNYVKAMSRSPKNMDALNKVRKDGNKNKFKIDVPTRWSSTYDMLTSFHDRAEDIKLMQDKHFTQLSPEQTFTEDEIDEVKRLLTFLEPFAVLTTVFQGEDQPTLPHVWPSIVSLRRHVSPEPKDSPLMAKLRADLRETLNKKFGDIESSKMLTLATMLAPCYAHLRFLTEVEAAAVHSLMKKELVTMVKKKIQTVKRADPPAANVPSALRMLIGTRELPSNEPHSAADRELERYLQLTSSEKLVESYSERMLDFWRDTKAVSRIWLS